jgi:hypothetical protein
LILEEPFVGLNNFKILPNYIRLLAETIKLNRARNVEILGPTGSLVKKAAIG